MFSLNDILQQAQGGEGIQNLAQQFGISPQQAQSAVEALMPALSAGMQTRAQDAGGLADLFGSMFNPQHQQAYADPGALNSAETAADGEDAVSRLFGNDQATQTLAAHAAQSTGLSSTLLQSMIPVIVSMLMGGMFKGMQNSGLGGMLEQLGRAGANSPGNSSGGLGDLLGQVLGGSLGGMFGNGEPQQGSPQQPQSRQQPQSPGGSLGDLLGGLLGGSRQPAPQQADQGRADQVFPPGFDAGSLKGGLDQLGKMLNPGGQSAGQQQPSLQDLLGQLLGGGRR